MKTTFITAAFMVALTVPALAADIVYAPEVPVQPVAARWDGLYIGAYGGWAGTRSRLKSAIDWVHYETSFPGARDWLSDDSYLLGATAGYNFQRGSWVLVRNSSWDTCEGGSISVTM